VHNVPPPLATSLPPPWSGDAPASGPARRLRNWLGQRGLERIRNQYGLPAHNEARRRLGLAPLGRLHEQYERADRLLVLTSAAFDFPMAKPPANLRYVGEPMEDEGVTAWTPPWPADDKRPLVLVSLSTLSQNQGRVLKRILLALREMPVKALVTLGPALDAADFEAPANVVMEAFVPHEAVLSHVDVMVSQCGRGSTTKALRFGVPLICIPLRADQPDNAARVVARGAGVSLARGATAEEIGSAIAQVLAEPSYRANARAFGESLVVDGAANLADELEALASGSRVATHV
jgi:MGT family glycosyltransferase